jgi:alkylation response protein AidB-like acyl-CoA dehydrogenase
MGYKGVDSTEAVFDGHRVPASRVLGGETGKGFYQMMDGVEVGRVNVAARGVGVANRAFELGAQYSQQRETFGKKIAEHQAVLFRLAEMATKVEAAHQMVVRAARKKDSGQRNDLEAGMAKYLASEYCSQVVEDSFRIHGGYGFSKEYEIERLYREAPMLLIGEGTADIQRMIIGRRMWTSQSSGWPSPPILKEPSPMRVIGTTSKYVCGASRRFSRNSSRQACSRLATVEKSRKS